MYICFLRKWVSEKQEKAILITDYAWFGEMSIMKSIGFRVGILISVLTLNSFGLQDKF